MSEDLAVAAILAMAFVSGCASTLYEGKYSWDEGWRKGVIEEVGGVAMRDKLAENCREKVPSAAMSARYATIKYRRDRRYGWRTVQIPSDASFKVGDLVFLNPWNCSLPVEPRRVDGGSVMWLPSK